MKNKILQVFIGSVSLLLLCIFLNILKEDITFFLTKTKAIATIKSIDSTSIEVVYYNAYKKDSLVASININSREFNKISDLRVKSTVDIFYMKFNTKTIFVERIKVPKLGILLFDIALVLFMIISLRQSILSLLKKADQLSSK